MQPFKVTLALGLRIAILISNEQICRGTAVMLVSPKEGTEEIANPFASQMEEM